MNNLDARAPDGFESILTNSRGAPRRIGDYLLVGQLGDDALGVVYRALHTVDGHFARLRVLQSPELPRRALLEAAQRRIHLSHPSEDIGRARSQLRVTDGIPYLVWPEARGWTLEFILARARAGGWGLPVELALLIAQRTAAQVEQARIAALGSRARYHGILWPGFVGITEDAVVDVAGFGLADIILPSLSQPRLWRDVAPYVAPETRETGQADERSDVYSIGVLLNALLTGRPASTDLPLPCWRADDDFSQDVSLLLHFALCEPSERFASVTELHACLAEIQAACPFETSPADLALFLYELLSPDSRVLPTPFDGSATNPLSSKRHREGSASRASLRFSARSRVPALLAPDPQPSSQKSPAIFGRSPGSRRVPMSRWAWRAAAVAAAIAGLIAVDLPLTGPAAPTRVPFPRIASRAPSGPGSRDVLPASNGVGDARLLVENVRPRLERSVARRLPARAPQLKSSREVRADMEIARLKAALERIEAERVDALVHAPSPYSEGRDHEQEGERLLTRRQYSEALAAYQRALGLFAEAESLSREERMRQISLARNGDS